MTELIPITRVCLALGNGDIFKGHVILTKLVTGLEDDREKDRVFAEGSAHGLGKIGEAYEKLVQTVEKQADGEVSAALGVALKPLRFVDKEFENDYIH